MRLPTLIIEGPRTDLKQFVAAQAAKAGFKTGSCAPEMAVHAAADPKTLLIWVTPQSPAARRTTNDEHVPPAKLSPCDVYANAVLFCNENFGALVIEVNKFLSDIKTGKVTSDGLGQHWRGYVMPTETYSAVVEAVRKRMTA